MTKKSELETVKKNEVAAIDFAADAGKGNENITGRDLAIPMLQLLQINSPQSNEDDAKYVEGARPGDLLDTVTKKVYSKKNGIKIVLAAYFSEFVEWKQREQGGGLVARHPISSTIAQTAKKDGGKLILPNGNTLVETHYHIGVMKTEEGALTWMIIPMTSTKLPVSKKLNKVLMDVRVNGVCPARYASVIVLNSIQQENAKGKFYNYDFKLEGFVQDADLYQAAKELNQAFTKGQVLVPVVEDDSEEKSANTDY